MIKNYFKKKFYNKDLDLIKDKTERFVVLMNDFKSAFGGWYSILAVRVLPMLLFFIPTNVVLARFNYYVVRGFVPDFDWEGPILMVMWVAAMILLLILAILAPKLASVFEFAFGFAYLFFVFRQHLYNTPLGITLMIVMTLYLLIKLFFLVVNIIGRVKFSGNGKGVERDESGRIIRSVDEDVFYVNSEDGKVIESNRSASSVDGDFVLNKTDGAPVDAPDARIAYDDDFFFDDAAKLDNDAAVTYNEEFVFSKTEDPKPDKNAPLATSDDDFFFG